MWRLARLGHEADNSVDRLLAITRAINAALHGWTRSNPLDGGGSVRLENKTELKFHQDSNWRVGIPSSPHRSEIKSEMVRSNEAMRASS
jgi:hypothetical protein